MELHKRTFLFAIICCGTVAALNMTAATVQQTYSGGFPGSVSGTLPDEGSVLELGLTLPTSGNFTAYTTSYATGGFQPDLTLFNSAGIEVASQGATPPANATANPTTGFTLDGLLTANGLTAGNYTLTLTDWELSQSPTATNLSDGFTFNIGDGTTFMDVNGATRTGSYTVDLAFTATPEPSSLFLTFLPFAAGFLYLRHRRSQVSQ